MSEVLEAGADGVTAPYPEMGSQLPLWFIKWAMRPVLMRVGNTVQVASLRRYILAHDIQGVDPQTKEKEELAAAVSRHWYNSVSPFHAPHDGHTLPLGSMQ